MSDNELICIVIGFIIGCLFISVFIFWDKFIERCEKVD